MGVVVAVLPKKGLEGEGYLAALCLCSILA